jgi:hypothetical protein
MVILKSDNGPPLNSCRQSRQALLPETNKKPTSTNIQDFNP